MGANPASFTLRYCHRYLPFLHSVPKTYDTLKYFEHAKKYSTTLSEIREGVVSIFLPFAYHPGGRYCSPTPANASSAT